MSTEESSMAVPDEPGGTGTQTISITKQANWQSSDRRAINSAKDIALYIPLTEQDISLFKEVEKTFPVRIPHYYLNLIKDFSDENDPIRQQCVPSVCEISEKIDEKVDPLGEEGTSPVPYLVHRYPDRALLLVTSRCFMYCRHCTRKRLWKNKVPDPTLKDIDKAVRYIREHKEIREVVISGGDPLTLPSERLDYILAAVAGCENIQAMRLGTRAPVVMPNRVNRVLCNVLKKYENLWINVQFNHPIEVTKEAAEACRRLQRCGIPISNQSVLLKGINDNVEVMKELCHKLQSIRVRPYYLFQCDSVIGTSHFWTSLYKGMEIIEKMRGWTGGLCIPTFVIDGEGGKGKIPVHPNYVVSDIEGKITFRNYKGETFQYANPE